MNPAPGFTLIELLIVIAIIGILIGILVPVVVRFKQQARVEETRARLVALKGALETYASRFGDYPPNSLSVFGVRMPNDTNLGIESATACLATQVDGRPPIENMTGEEDLFGNTDGDAVGRNVTKWFFGDNALREILDSWGNPVVYFHFRDYTRPDAFSKYKIGGKVQTCKPQKDASTATFVNPQKYQIWSAGPDGVNENGGGDDVVVR
jgi:prepilin-type N-terminal cleavage/methylation domain-containing protein